jgi:hypothetical protein
MALILPNGTWLVLTPLDAGVASIQLTPYAARGLTQTLEPLSGAGGGNWLRRDVNGILRSLADTRFRKYRSTITCTDGETPCLDDGWIGETVQVNCALELNHVTGATPARGVVPGSTRTQGTVTYYRPIMTMLVAGIKISGAEYPATYAWQIDLEEV